MLNARTSLVAIVEGMPSGWATDRLVRQLHSTHGMRLAAESWGRSDKNTDPVKVWDAETGNEIQSFAEHTPTLLALAFTDGGQRLAAATSHRYTVWDMSKEAEVSGFPLPRSSAAAILPGGARLATTGLDGRVTVWDTATGQQVLALRGFAGQATCLTFSKDGQRLAAGGIEGQGAAIRIWDATTGATGDH